MEHRDSLEADIQPKNYKFQVFQQSLNITNILAISRPLINLYAPYFQEMLIYICDHLKPKILKSEKIIFLTL